MKNKLNKKNRTYLPFSDGMRTTFSVENLIWKTDSHGRRVQMIDAGGFVFHLDKKGGIISMSDPNGKTFKCR